MTKDEFRETLDELGMTQRELARQFRIDPRLVRDWASGDKAVSPMAELLLDLMRNVAEARRFIEARGQS
jgi:DNA-binding transcriptional regulator YiaG